MKIDRDKVKMKFGGKCAYTGQDLGDDWQVDHMTSKYVHGYRKIEGDVNDISNLMPALRIVNHYKREKGLESFRRYMLTFHKRLYKLPKKTTVPATERRIIYMNKIADAFGITTEKPFDGVFYFEKLK